MKNPKFKVHDKYWLDDDEDGSDRRRGSSRKTNRVSTPVTVAPIRTRPRKHGGMGGHMTASLLQQMVLYDELMRRAEREKKDNFKGMKANRSHYMKRIRERLSERGYAGPFPVPV